MKTCLRCGESKLLAEFNRHGAGQHHPYCRHCRSAYRGGGRKIAVEELRQRGFKRCCDCEEVKPLAEFYVRRDRPGKRMALCKACGLLRGKNWRKKYPDKARAKMRRQSLKRSHGITVAQWDAMLAAQGGRCAVCGTTEPGGNGGFHVDHDHACCPSTPACGQCVRGLLCNRCNTGIGQFQDDPKRLRNAAQYLECPRGVMP